MPGRDVRGLYRFIWSDKATQEGVAAFAVDFDVSWQITRGQSLRADAYPRSLRSNDGPATPDAG
jgi:hypothetical protein